MSGGTHITRALANAEAGRPLSHTEAMALADCDDLPRLTALAEQLCLAGHGHTVSFSKKVFIPLTRLCRDVCHYCTFARAPSEHEPHYLSPEAVLDIARKGQAAGCKEALFTLGDQPERRYGAARSALDKLGAASTLAYLESSAALVLRETGLLPHLNPGIMDESWLARLRAVSVSQGMMLETAAQRLSERGGPHFGSPDKVPAVRLATLEAAGRARVPFTTGILIGIGETRAERIEALLAIRDLHERYGHIQEVIIQNFRAKPGTRMATAAEPALEDHVWTVAVARIVLGPTMNIQAPPNLQPEGLAALIGAGINDWGGVSPVTPDHVNPEAPWPHLRDLERATEAAGRTLGERLAIYPEFLPPSPRKRGEGWGEGQQEGPTRATTLPPRHAGGVPSARRGGRAMRPRFSAASAVRAANSNGRAKPLDASGGGGRAVCLQTPPPDAPNELAPYVPIRLARRRKQAALTRGASSSPLEGEGKVTAAAERWLDPALHTPVLRHIDAMGLAREDTWSPGADQPLPAAYVALLRGSDPPPQRSRRNGNAGCEGSDPLPISAAIARTLDRAAAGNTLSEAEIVGLFEARGADFTAVCRAADRLRAARVGDVVTYVVNRNINYTNICTYGCKFCAFSKGRHSFATREKPYDLGLDEIARRTREAWQRGATEVCLQGGIRPGYTGATYLSVVDAVKSAAPDIHVHAFSPLEIWHGAETLGLPLHDYLARLQGAGLASLPGTAAEILDDEVRAILCPDKISTAQWLQVMEAAHDVGLKSTATIMFGHVDSYRHWARHLLRVRELQTRTGGFTEFVPLPFVHMEAPIYLKGQARKGPTFREAVLMHAVARLALDPVIANVQASWVKMGPDGAALCLETGANDMGGVLMNESITRAAGAVHGQQLCAQDMQRIIRTAGRTPQQRATLYGPVPAERMHVASRAKSSRADQPTAVE